MIVTSGDFIIKAANANRRPQFFIAIDWDFNQLYQEETETCLSIEIERTQNEPFGGVTLAQADVTFFNKDNRFTPVE